LRTGESLHDFLPPTETTCVSVSLFNTQYFAT